MNNNAFEMFFPSREEINQRNYIDHIPEEILVKIFEWLPVRDLCNAILVSKYWRKIGEDPVLWKHYLLEINYGTKLLPETLKFKRFSKLENLIVRGFDPYNEDQMRFSPSLVVNSSIKKLELRLAYIDRNVSDFSSLVKCLSSLTLIFCLMTQDQLDLMFSQLCDHCSLSELAILMPLVNTSSAEENYLTDGLSKIEPLKFVRGIARIKHLKLRETGLTVDQINLLMIEIIDGDNIKSLDIIDKNISQANVQNMIEAFNSLDSLSLHYGTIIGMDKMNMFLNGMGESKSRLMHSRDVDQLGDYDK